jgi:DNA-binding response OmpR family regulator
VGTPARTAGDQPRALAIGEDSDVRQSLRHLLQAAGVLLVEPGPGRSGLRALYDERPDVVVLDLTGSDDLDALRRIRELSDVPVVALTAEDSEEDRMSAFRAGADDCVSKPAGPELTVRIEALLRRPRPSIEVAAIIEDDFIRIDRARHRVLALGEEVDLTPIEFKMLGAFAENPGRVLGHGQLLDMVWGDRIRARDEVKLYVSYLRRKFGAAGVDPVETVRGVGYRYLPRRA